MTFEASGTQPVHGEIAFKPFDVLWENKYFLILVSIIATLITAAVLEQKPPMYSADGSMIFRFSREYLPSDAAIETWQGEPVRVLVNDAIHTEMEILGSSRVLKSVLQVTPELLSEETVSETLEQLEKALSIRRIEGSYVVRVSFENNDAELAEVFLTRLFATYFQERELLLKASPAEALGRAALEAAEAAQNARKAAINFQSGYGLVDIDQQMNDLVAQRIQLVSGMQNETERPNNSVRIPTTNAQIRALDKRIGLLGERQAKLAELVIAAEIAEETYRQTQSLANSYRLSAKIDTARGPIIEVLDAPTADTKPIGLPLAIQAVLGGALGFLLVSVIVLLIDWRKLRKPALGKSLENLPSPLVDTLKRRQAEAMNTPGSAREDA